MCWQIYMSVIWFSLLKLCYWCLIWIYKHKNQNDLLINIELMLLTVAALKLQALWLDDLMDVITVTPAHMHTPAHIDTPAHIHTPGLVADGRLLVIQTSSNLSRLICILLYHTLPYITTYTEHMLPWENPGLILMNIHKGWRLGGSWLVGSLILLLYSALLHWSGKTVREVEEVYCTCYI
jgi:hypothetical protein